MTVRRLAYWIDWDTDEGTLTAEGKRLPVVHVSCGHAHKDADDPSVAQARCQDEGHVFSDRVALFADFPLENGLWAFLTVDEHVVELQLYAEPGEDKASTLRWVAGREGEAVEKVPGCAGHACSGCWHDPPLARVTPSAYPSDVEELFAVLGAWSQVELLKERDSGTS